MDTPQLQLRARLAADRAPARQHGRRPHPGAPGGQRPGAPGEQCRGPQSRQARPPGLPYRAGRSTNHSTASGSPGCSAARACSAASKWRRAANPATAVRVGLPPVTAGGTHPNEDSGGRGPPPAADGCGQEDHRVLDGAQGQVAAVAGDRLGDRGKVADREGRRGRRPGTTRRPRRHRASRTGSARRTTPTGWPTWPKPGTAGRAGSGGAENGLALPARGGAPAGRTPARSTLPSLRHGVMLIT